MTGEQLSRNQLRIAPPPPPKDARYGPGLPTIPSGKPRKMPGFGGHPEVGYTELF